MADSSKWITHFEKMAKGLLPAGSQYIVSSRGGGGSRSYFRVNPTVISPAQQVVNQAKFKVLSAKGLKSPPGVAKGRPRGRPPGKKQTRRGMGNPRGKLTGNKSRKRSTSKAKPKARSKTVSRLKTKPKPKSKPRKKQPQDILS